MTVKTVHLTQATFVSEDNFDLSPDQLNALNRLLETTLNAVATDDGGGILQSLEVERHKIDGVRRIAFGVTRSSGGRMLRQDEW